MPQLPRRCTWTQTEQNVAPVDGCDRRLEVPDAAVRLAGQLPEHQQANQTGAHREGDDLKELDARAVQHLQSKERSCGDGLYGVKVRGGIRAAGGLHVRTVI